MPVPFMAGPRNHLSQGTASGPAVGMAACRGTRRPLPDAGPPGVPVLS
jgi:hypothetical protein